MFASEKWNWHAGWQGIVVFNIKTFWWYLICLTLTFKIFAILNFNLLGKSISIYVCMCTQHCKSFWLLNVNYQKRDCSLLKWRNMKEYNNTSFEPKRPRFKFRFCHQLALDEYSVFEDVDDKRLPQCHWTIQHHRGDQIW